MNKKWKKKLFLFLANAFARPIRVRAARAFGNVIVKVQIEHLALVLKTTQSHNNQHYKIYHQKIKYLISSFR